MEGTDHKKSSGGSRTQSGESGGSECLSLYEYLLHCRRPRSETNRHFAKEDKDAATFEQAGDRSGERERERGVADLGLAKSQIGNRANRLRRRKREITRPIRMK